MRKIKILITLAAVLAASAFAQQSGANGNLEQVLSLMDRTAANLKTVQADFQWDNYTAAIGDTETQKGVTYFRRNGANVDMAADIREPADARKYLLFNNGLLQIYNQKSGTVQRFESGKNREAFESFLVLGFGGRGHDLSKNFDVKYVGTEKIGNANAYRLDLTPKQDKVRNMFSVITLWIDPQMGVSVQQKFTDAGAGQVHDYRLTKYTNIKMNPKLGDVFKIKK